MNDPYLTYSDYILERMSNTKVRDLNDIIEFVTANHSELSELSDDEDIDQHDEWSEYLRKWIHGCWG